MKILNNYVKKSLVICIVIIFCVLSITGAYATYFSGTLINRSNGFVTVWEHSSVSSNNYRSHFSDARNGWQGIDFDKMAFIVSSADNEKYDKYYVGTTAVSGLFGLTDPRKKNILGQLVVAQPNDDWYHSLVTIYDNQIVSYGLTEDRSTLTTHEVGHEIKMAHAPSTKVSIMREHDWSQRISDYDIQEFNAKW